jgi:hypothetical protein
MQAPGKTGGEFTFGAGNVPDTAQEMSPDW